VIVPTRELAAQVREELDWLYAGIRGLRVEVVTGGTSIGMERRALSRKPGLVVGTPGRLLDHMRNGALECDAVAHVILDEADQMLDMGFRDELEAIVELLPEARSSHLVSATFPRAVVDLAKRYQKDVMSIEGTRLGVANADIHHIAYSIRRHETYAALVNVLLMADDSRCLLFVNRRVDAMELAEKLASDGFGAAPFSGELPQAQRTRTLNAFRNGTFKILVSTDVAARGIDVPDISTVVHVDPPRTPDAYTHRSGRTGRAGRTGRSILLVVGPETNRVTRLLRAARVEVSWQPIPPPEKVRKALMKQARRKLHERLADDERLSESQLLYARQLLEEKDPARLVATLLEMAAPKPPCEPKPVMGLDPFAERRPGRGASRAAARPPRDRDAGPTEFTRFLVNWGERTGATASRLLSHVCRRGGLASHQVGAIQIDARSSTVDIASDVAASFAAKTRRPDKRDPGILIRPVSESSSVPAFAGARPSHRRNERGTARSPTASRPPIGPARESEGAARKRSGRPTPSSRLKRKPPRRTASR
jgi:ATP-dependent RNA helicase DeaD